MPENSNRTLADNLRAFRAERGWSQEEFADRCGLHRTYIGAIERGERNVTLTGAQISAAASVGNSHISTQKTRADMGHPASVGLLTELRLDWNPRSLARWASSERIANRQSKQEVARTRVKSPPTSHNQIFFAPQPRR